NHYFLRTRRPLVCGCPDAAGRPAACLTGPTRPVIGAALSSRCEWVDAAHHVARRHAHAAPVLDLAGSAAAALRGGAESRGIALRRGRRDPPRRLPIPVVR